MLPRFLYAPVSRGDVVGRIEYILDGKIIDEVSIVSSDTVEPKKKEGFFERILNYLRGN